jgi:hypothetical protein
MRSNSRVLLFFVLGVTAAGLWISERVRSASTWPTRVERGVTLVRPVSDGVAKEPDRASVGSLFRVLEAVDAARLTSALPAPARVVHYVRLDRAWLAGKHSPFWQAPGAGRIQIPMSDGSSLVVVIDGSEMLGADRFTSRGHVEGSPGSRATFAWNEGYLHASIEDPARVILPSVLRRKTSASFIKSTRP